MKFITFSLVIVLVFYNSAQAYIDPGLGSMLIQGLIAVIAAGVAYTTLYWRKFKDFLKRFNNSSKDKYSDTSKDKDKKD